VIASSARSELESLPTLRRIDPQFHRHLPMM
jgi:hypothetical protein